MGSSNLPSICQKGRVNRGNRDNQVNIFVFKNRTRAHGGYDGAAITNRCWAVGHPIPGRRQTDTTPLRFAGSWRRPFLPVRVGRRRDESSRLSTESTRRRDESSRLLGDSRLRCDESSRGRKKTTVQLLPFTLRHFKNVFSFYFISYAMRAF